MLNDIITYLDSRLSSYFQKNWGLVSRIVEAEKTYPAKYCSGGKYDLVSNFSKYSGSSYWRKNGIVSSVVTEHPRISSKRQVELTIPLRGVFVVRKKELPNDNEYSSYELATELTKALTPKANTLKETLKASRCDILETGYETESSEVFASEYAGVDSVSLDTKYAYVYIDFNIVVQINRECIPDMC